jgi:predicted Zn-dependent protease
MVVWENILGVSHARADPTEMDVFHKRLLIAAQGYSELGLPDLALAELSLIPEELQGESVVVETMLSVLMQAQRWTAALPVGQELCRLEPEKSAGFIHAAFCLHELGNTMAARELLMSGPAQLKAEATYHYNLACYEAKLGNLDQARAYLDVSFAMDKKLKEFALDDPDLDVLKAFKLASNR